MRRVVMFVFVSIVLCTSFVLGAISSETDVEFSVAGWACHKPEGSGYAYWANVSNDGGVQIHEKFCADSNYCPTSQVGFVNHYETNGFKGAFFDIDGSDSLDVGESCCPVGKDAEGSGTNDKDGVCSGTKYVCEDFTDENGCDTADSTIIQTSYEAIDPRNKKIKLDATYRYLDATGTNFCGRRTSASCKWNDSAPANAQCSVDVITREGLNDTSNTASCGDSQDSYSCRYQFKNKTDMCESFERKIISYYDVLGPVDKCDSDGTPDGLIKASYPCIASLRLPFFNMWNFFVSAISITIVYFLMTKRKNRKFY